MKTIRSLSAPALAILAGVLAGASAGAAAAAPGYTLVKSTPLGAPDRWDYVVVSAGTGRVYVAHGDRLAVLDAKSGDLVGQVEGIPGGTHGTAVSIPTGLGFTDDGKAGQVVAFDLKTLKIVKQIAADKDADGIAFDKATGHVFVVEGDPGAVAVIDPKTLAQVAVVKAGEKLEYAAGDGHGAVFAAGEEKGDLVKIDAHANAVVAHWATPECKSPHGLAVDAEHHRAFMGCVNSLMVVVDTKTGKEVAKLPIGRGNDAVAFDPVRGRVFSSNGLDGTVSVYQEASPDRYALVETLTTAVSGRTMDVDPATGRLYVAAADVDPPATPGGRPRPRAGTLRLMMFDPAK